MRVLRINSPLKSEATFQSTPFKGERNRLFPAFFTLKAFTNRDFRNTIYTCFPSVSDTGDMSHSNETHRCGEGRAILARGKLLDKSSRFASCKDLYAKRPRGQRTQQPLYRFGDRQRLLDHGNYVRQRDLPGLLHLFPAEIETLGARKSDTVLRMIMRALRAERKRGETGHWRYSMNRHIGLLQAFRAEKRYFTPGAGS